MKSSVRKINTQSLRSDSNVYVVKLAENGSTVFAGSRGASESQCESLAGTFVLMQVAEGRFWSVVNALNNANDFSTPTSSGAIASQDCMGRLNATHFCTKCGKLLSALDAETHDCSSVCSVCGATLTAAEKKAGKCISCLRKRFAYVYNYHGTPSDMRRPRFTSETMRAKKLHLGLEIEFSTGLSAPSVSTLGKAIDLILNENPLAGNDVHFERDCSLSGNGFEVITNPQTLRAFRQQSKKFNEFFKYLKDNDGNMRNCGSHIHIDRAFFGENAVACGLYMGSYIARHWDNLFAKLAGGAVNAYSRPIPYNGGSVVAYAARLYQSAYGHNVFFNLGNSDTIELRFWRGTLDYTQTLAYLDITQALAQWAKHRNDSNFVKSNPSDIFKWAQFPANTWAYVQRCITDTQLLADIRKALDVCDGTDY